MTNIKSNQQTEAMIDYILAGNVPFPGIELNIPDVEKFLDHLTMLTKEQLRKISFAIDIHTIVGDSLLARHELLANLQNIQIEDDIINSLPIDKEALMCHPDLILKHGVPTDLL